MTPLHEPSSKDVTINLTGYMTTVPLDLNKDVKIMLLDGRRRLDTMRKLHVDGEQRWIQ